MDSSQTQGSSLSSDDAHDLLCKATRRIVQLEELLSQRDSELKDHKSLYAGLQREFEEANQSFKNTHSKNLALLGLLSHVRKLHCNSSKSLADMRVSNRTMCDAIRFMSTVQSSNETLYQEIEAQKHRADSYSALLDKAIEESKKLGLSSPNSDHLILRSWRAEEISLRQEIIELSVENTLQARIQAQAREEAVHQRLSEAVAKEYDIGYVEGYARGREEAVRRSVALDNINFQVDEFLTEAISALDGSNDKARRKMLDAFQDALAAPHDRPHFC